MPRPALPVDEANKVNELEHGLTDVSWRHAVRNVGGRIEPLPVERFRNASCCFRAHFGRLQGNWASNLVNPSNRRQFSRFPSAVPAIHGIPFLLRLSARQLVDNDMTTRTDLESGLPAIESWKDLLEDILPPQGQWSEDEYLVLTDHRNRFIEFTDGFLEVLPWPTCKHQMVLGFLLRAFSNFFDHRGGIVLFAPLRLQIRPGKFREPDLLLLLSASDPRNQDRFWLGADLALEVVSEHKPERDLVERRADYAEGGVPEYWIVNPMSETIAVLRLQGAAYEEAGLYRRGQAATSVLRPEFSVPVADVFDSAQIKRT
jgi:Uma2 family endonuclease